MSFRIHVNRVDSQSPAARPVPQFAKPKPSGSNPDCAVVHGVRDFRKNEQALVLLQHTDAVAQRKDKALIPVNRDIVGAFQHRRKQPSRNAGYGFLQNSSTGTLRSVILPDKSGCLFRGQQLAVDPWLELLFHGKLSAHIRRPAGSRLVGHKHTRSFLKRRFPDRLHPVGEKTDRCAGHLVDPFAHFSSPA